MTDSDWSEDHQHAHHASWTESYYGRSMQFVWSHCKCGVRTKAAVGYPGEVTCNACFAAMQQDDEP